MWLRLPSWRVLVGWAVLAGAVIICGALLVAWSGVINVAASRGHWAVTTWFLELGMRGSVRTHAASVTEPPRLDDMELVRLGAGHYAGGCAPCHGSPAEPRNPIYLRMLPEPTELSEAVPGWTSRQLFWIVKHGIKYSGMPAWVARQRDDEIWAVVAFLRTLPRSNPKQYRELAAGNVEPQEETATELLRDGVSRAALSACARCHGDEQAAPTSRLVPSLAGQDQAYLTRALVEYAAGRRQSGIMQPVAAALDEDAITQLASHYANLPVRSAPQRVVSPDVIEDGRRIATVGVPGQSLPACTACHRDGARSLFPMLDGQAARYLAGQLRLWQTGGRTSTVHGRIMAAIATRLTEQQIAAVTAYFESVAPVASGATSAGSGQGWRP